MVIDTAERDWGMTLTAAAHFWMRAGLRVEVGTAAGSKGGVAVLNLASGAQTLSAYVTRDQLRQIGDAIAEFLDLSLMSDDELFQWGADHVTELARPS